MLVLNLPAFEIKKYTAYAMETFRMAKSRPRKNQSERWDLPLNFPQNMGEASVTRQKHKVESSKRQLDLFSNWFILMVFSLL